MASLFIKALQKSNPNFTDIDRRTCHRVVPMEVMCFGASRTGTSSLREALKILKYDEVYHAVCVYTQNPRDADMWVEAMRAKFHGEGKKYTKEDWDQLLGHCMGVTDAPCIFFIEDLLEAYPEAKVILTVRDSSDSWWKSVSSTLIPMTDRAYGTRVWDYVYRFFLPRQRFQDMNDEMLKLGSAEDFKKYGPKWYDGHNKNVKEFIKERDEKLEKEGKSSEGLFLEFNLKEGWEPLCKFLGKEVPRDEEGKVREFPRKNDTSAFIKNAGVLDGVMNICVGINMSLTIATGVGIYFAARRYLKFGRD